METAKKKMRSSHIRANKEQGACSEYIVPPVDGKRLAVSMSLFT